MRAWRGGNISLCGWQANGGRGGVRWRESSSRRPSLMLQRAIELLRLLQHIMRLSRLGLHLLQRHTDRMALLHTACERLALDTPRQKKAETKSKTSASDRSCLLAFACPFIRLSLLT